MARRNEPFEFKVWQGVGCAVLFFVVLFVGLGAAADYTVSDGMRLGTINKFSKKGVFWKSYEGELTMAGFTAATASGANVWDFSVDRGMTTSEAQALTAKLTTLAEKGERVKIRYRQVFIRWPWRSETDYYVQSVEPCTEVAEKK